MTDLRDLTQRMEHLRAAGDFTDYMIARGLGLSPDRYPERFRKAAVAAATTDTAAALARTSLDFVDVVQRGTLLGKMAGAWLPVPPFCRVVGTDVEPDVAWTKEGNPAPVAKMDFAAVTSDATSFRVLVGVTAELLKMADARGRRVLEGYVVRALRRAEDRELLGDDAKIPGERPAGLLYGVSASGAGSPATLSTDLEALWTSVRDGDPERPFFICSPRAAMYLHALRENDAPLFPNIGPLGGTIAGVSVLASRAAGNRLILLDASQLAVTDNGLEVDASTDAAVVMDDAPSAGPASVVSAFMSNSVFLRFVRLIGWTLAADDAVGFVELPLISNSPA